MTTKRIHKKGLQKHWRLVLYDYHDSHKIPCAKALRTLCFDNLQDVVKAMHKCRTKPVVIHSKLGAKEAFKLRKALVHIAEGHIDVRQEGE